MPAAVKAARLAGLLMLFIFRFSWQFLPLGFAVTASLTSCRCRCCPAAALLQPVLYQQYKAVRGSTWRSTDKGACVPDDATSCHSIP